MEKESIMITHRHINVDGLELFYREAGPTTAPHLLLLHGFPTSSHMFRNLIPALAGGYHVVAPDLSGFGFSDDCETSVRIKGRRMRDVSAQPCSRTTAGPWPAIR
jgi:pimeloyl-ACP methyl ester carboxylesterase